MGLTLTHCGGQASLGETQSGAPPGRAYLLNTSVVDKVDLLLVVDNSISMADKQEQLAQAIPQLVNRLVDPICVDPTTGAPTVDSSSLDGCDPGEAEFRAVEDLHVGVVTSSLGGHGGTLCTAEHGEQYYNETQNDRARLITRGGDGGTVDTWSNSGFLSWDPSQSANNPPPGTPGSSDRAEFSASLQNLGSGAGELGCGFEAPLEAMYRFLVDPKPPADVVRVSDPETGEELSTPVAVDEIVLEQRKQFLRPDSLVLIVILSDADDCSIMDEGLGWFVGNTREGTMPRSNSVCDTDPNDPCCLSCIDAEWPDACDNPANDPKCQQGFLQNQDDDRLNLRCFENRRRFGMDFLYPTSRYSEGLKNHEITAYDGEVLRNPLFAGNDYYPESAPRMDSSNVFLAAIVGVPWQDIATDESLSDPVRLEFLSAAELESRGIWRDILGDPHASPPVPPRDPFMVQSITPRTGVNPRTGISIEPPVEAAGGNAINGHEYDIQRNSDLQYACIFPLPESRECADIEAGRGCDCKVSNEIFMRPLCEGTTQVYAKAYPGSRFLEVLKGYGENSILASICPKNVTGSAADPNYGLNPAVHAIVEGIRPAFRGRCLPEPLPLDEAYRPLCSVVEVSRAGSTAAPCGDHIAGRKVVNDSLKELTFAHLTHQGLCGTEHNPCSGYSLCELTQAPGGAEYQSCMNDNDANVQATGYCYIDAMTDRDGDGAVECQPDERDAAANPIPGTGLFEDCIGNPELVWGCPDDERRLLRFASPPNAEAPLPWPGSTIMVVCPED